MPSILYLPAVLAAATSVVNASPTTKSPGVNTTICNKLTYVYEELAGYGYLASDFRDRYGDSVSLGSSIAIDKSTWSRRGNVYEGLMYALPDRGWNTNGTINFQGRIYKLWLTLTLDENASVENPSGPNLDIKYLDSLLLHDIYGQHMTGLDADATGPYLAYPEIFPFPKFPEVPSAKYSGDGFGGTGPGGFHMSLDSEGLVLGVDGTFWVSDEYGPYIYQFSADGLLLQTIEPPAAFVPMRNNSVSFSADSPPIYDLNMKITPSDNPTGRDNNQGFEGLTVSSDGTKLFALTQSALNQDGGLKKMNRRYARLVEYDLSSTKIAPTYVAEYVVPLPLYDGDSQVAAQSEIHYISDKQFLVLARDRNAGHGQKSSESVYRNVDIFDISSATNIKSALYDAHNGTISPDGVLNPKITPAQYCTWLDFNVNSQLNRFGVHNGGDQNETLLNEKWESLALLPVDLHGKNEKDEYFLFSFSDNDFITQNGYMNFGRYPYSDASGYNVDNQALVFKVRLPKGTNPLV
ncbi:conserved hypothetical protein [Talaromyces stipitatus ATCC 10500]|uniref:Phytase-like domain-containing protein n=1 Tax=Talaromyces stipitatus (strain ATCC 10500 / CBS 375.48 / QM 6759 / NRRL 1006) TaxID=441959 RepID=B8M446_TALSN|nr:uncharacterized protein TSTA_039830 [Talaromyces stipitatus ATCC 10500]EED20789.1 conserved hypothetical protein [Talaromyces stipitatus ATCC 10500]